MFAPPYWSVMVIASHSIGLSFEMREALYIAPQGVGIQFSRVRFCVAR